MRVDGSAHQYVFYPATLLLVVVTTLIVTQPEVGMFRIFSAHAEKILFGILGAGLLFMVIRWHRLMFVAFACAGVLALFLRSSTNTSAAYAAPNLAGGLEVLLVNAGHHDGDYTELTDLLITSDADLVSVQEVTPDWAMALRGELAGTFPHSCIVPSIGFNGMAVFSRLPFSQLDTFYYNNTPNIMGKMRFGGNDKPIGFVCTYTDPPLDTDNYYQELRGHFDKILEHAKTIPVARLAMGTYNIKPWSVELMAFTSDFGVRNSRRFTSPFQSMVDEQIFHAEAWLECSDLSPLYNANGTPLGLRGRFQFKNTIDTPYAQQPTQ